MASTSAGGARSTDAGRPGRPAPAVRRRGAEEVQRITTAPVGQRQHQQQQIGKYLISMGVRTACIILLIVIPGPVRWVFVPLAVVLPYIAVLMANAGRETVRPTSTQVTPVARPALGPAVPQEPLVGDVHAPDGAPPRHREAGEGDDGAAQRPRVEEPDDEWPDDGWPGPGQHVTSSPGSSWRGAA